MPDLTIGVSLGRKHLRLVQLRREGGSEEVVRTLELPAPEPLDLAFLMDDAKRAGWHQELTTLVGDLPADATAVVAIPVGFCALRVFPADADLTEDELAEQSKWELEHLVLSSPDEYYYGSDRIQAEVGLTDTAVLVAVRKSVATAVRDLLSGLGPRIVAVEADIFAAQRAFEHNYDLDDLHPTMLLERSGSRLNGVVLKRGGTFRFLSDLLPELGDDTPASTAAEAFRNAAERLARAQGVLESLEELAGIYLYGDEQSEAFVDALRDTSEARVEKLNPFRRLRLAPDAIDELVLETRPEGFAAAVGASLW